jgi:hypothetical protein
MNARTMAHVVLHCCALLPVCQTKLNVLLLSPVQAAALAAGRRCTWQ